MKFKINPKLLHEIDAIVHRYNFSKRRQIPASPWHSEEEIFLDDDYDEDELETLPEVTIENFEEIVDWDWVVRNYHLSNLFIWEYRSKLDLKYLFENYIIMEEEYHEMVKDKTVGRFQLLDLEEN